MSNEIQNLARRGVLKGSAAAGLLMTLQGLQMRNAAAANATVPVVGPYGAIAPVNDITTGLPLLQLPRGFTYKSYGWTNDVMSNGQPCPGNHDGMAVIVERRVGRSSEIVLVRNHERSNANNLIDAPAKYDAVRIGSNYAGGGTTNLVFRDGNWVRCEPSLGGTLTNCAGGPTPWGTWLTCEETTTTRATGGGKKHGYVFEVTADPTQTTGNPIVQMGRFAHEAAAVDPATGYVYLTEDRRNVSTFYRFVPNDTSGQPGSLEKGGTLQAARVVGSPNASLLAPNYGDIVQLEWVDLDNPDADPGVINLPFAANAAASGPFIEAWNKGALRMSRGEGLWTHNGHVYIVDTSTGIDNQGREGYGEGCVWRLNFATQRMEAIFVSDKAVAGNNPDNITVSPRGGVLTCEDGGGVNDAYGFGDRCMGLLPNGETYVFCKNNVVLSTAQIANAGKNVAAGDYRGNEFCGATFDASGRVLFVNIQTPGITFAITGPWGNGNL